MARPAASKACTLSMKAVLPEPALEGLAHRPSVRFLKRWEAADKLHPRLAAGQVGLKACT